MLIEVVSRSYDARSTERLKTSDLRLPVPFVVDPTALLLIESIGLDK